MIHFNYEYKNIQSKFVDHKKTISHHFIMSQNEKKVKTAYSMNPKLPCGICKID